MWPQMPCIINVDTDIPAEIELLRVTSIKCTSMRVQRQNRDDSLIWTWSGIWKSQSLSRLLDEARQKERANAISWGFWFMGKGGLWGLVNKGIFQSDGKCCKSKWKSYQDYIMKMLMQETRCADAQRRKRMMLGKGQHLM